MLQSRYLAAALLALTVPAACRTAARPLPSAAETQLAEIQQSPAVVGDAVYEGSVFPLDGRTSPLFRYERRVRLIEGGLQSTHVTQDPSGSVVVVQSANHSASYDLVRADLTHGQTGVTGAVEVQGTQVTFTLNEQGRVSTSVESADAPVVAGPTMFGYIVTHWDELMRGARLPIRFAVIERKETIGFTLERIPAPAGRTIIRMKPSSWLLGLAVDATSFEFETATRRILEYTGRVPPMEVVNAGLKTLDARVTYDFRAPVFR